MTVNNTIVAIYGSHVEPEAALNTYQNSSFGDAGNALAPAALHRAASGKSSA